MPLEPRSKLGPYEIVSLISSGGMGEVYRARDKRLERDVAVKILAPALLERSDAIARFEREARAASALNHPHILHIYDIGSEQETYYMAMELVQGETLRAKLAHERDRASVIEWMRQVAEALAKAHAAGIVHRDLKPDNIMVTDDGYAKVLDFGLAKLMEREPISNKADDAGATAIRGMQSEPGLVMGTVGYMAPEQAHGLDVDHRADIYSFGCVLHEALSPLDAAADADLQRIVSRCLERNREQRYQSMKDLAIDLADTMRRSQPPRELSGRARGGSIAVLPFDDLSPAKDSDYLGDGVAEEIITDLSKIAALRVVSRASAAQFKGTRQQPPAIARSLDVQYLVTGSVRRAGERLRLTVQLLDAPGDVTIWAEKFDGTMDEIFDIQEKLARSIATQLRLKVTSEESGKIRERPIENVRAYECYLRARVHMYNFTEASLDAALLEIDRALEIAGDNVLLYATKGIIYFQYYNTGVKQDPAMLDRAEELARRIQELERDSPRAKTLFGLVAVHRPDLPAAVRYLKAALAQDPNDIDALGWLPVLYLLAGKSEEARPVLARLNAVDPMSWIARLMTTLIANYDGDFDLAIQQLAKVEEKVPFETAYRIQLLLLSRRFDEAAGVSDELLHRDPSDLFTRMAAMLRFGLEGNRVRVVEMFTEQVAAAARNDLQYSTWISEAFALLGDAEQSADWMRNALSRGYTAYPYLTKHDWFFDKVREDARFKAVLEEMRAKWEAFDE